MIMTAKVISIIVIISKYDRKIIINKSNKNFSLPILHLHSLQKLLPSPVYCSQLHYELLYPQQDITCMAIDFRIKLKSTTELVNDYLDLTKKCSKTYLSRLSPIKFKQQGDFFFIWCFKNLKHKRRISTWKNTEYNKS